MKININWYAVTVLALIGLKIAGYISWPWLVILAVALLPFAIVLAIVLIVLIGAGIALLFKSIASLFRGILSNLP